MEKNDGQSPQDFPRRNASSPSNDATSPLCGLLSASNEKARAAEERAQAAEEHVQELKLAKEKETRPTTFREFLVSSHNDVLSNISINTLDYSSTVVPSSPPTNKSCPALTKPWSNFEDIQKSLLHQLDDGFARHRVFPSKQDLSDRGMKLRTMKESDEAFLDVVKMAYEDLVLLVLRQLQAFQPQVYSLPVLEDIFFKDAVSKIATTPESKARMRVDRLRMDRICVIGKPKQPKQVAYVMELKSPKKLYNQHLELGLQPMSIYDRVAQKTQIPTTEPERTQHCSEYLSSAAIVQAYHHMLNAGLEYGCVANGHAFVFLHVDWADTTVMYYHLAQPAHEVAVNEEPDFSNGVAQLAAFTVLAASAPTHSADEREEALKKCKVWKFNVDLVVEEVAACVNTEERTSGLDSTQYHRLPHSPGWEPKRFKPSKRGPADSDEREDKSTCKGKDGHVASFDQVICSRRRPDQDSLGGDAPGASGGSSFAHEPAQQQPEPERPSTPRSQGQASDAAGQQHQAHPIVHPPAYCTALCLLTLVRGRMLDNKCPNNALHLRHTLDKTNAVEATGKAGQVTHHPISHEEFVALLRAQLGRTFDAGMVDLQSGGFGAMFQVTLLEHGYTFLGKGVPTANIRRAWREKGVYQRLEPLHGRGVPVYLGAVDLRPLNRRYCYDFDTVLEYFSFMSYGGQKVPSADLLDREAQKRVIKSLVRVVDGIHGLGVVHGNVRLSNVRQSPTGPVTLIGFDLATVHPLSALGGAKVEAIAIDNRNPRAIAIKNLRAAKGEVTGSRSPSSIAIKKRRRLEDGEVAGKDSYSGVLGRLMRAKMRTDREAARRIFTDALP